MLPCHWRKGQVETATDTFSPQVNFAKPSRECPFPRPPRLPRDECTEFLKVGPRFRPTFLTTGNLFSRLRSPLAGLKLPIAAFVAKTLGVKQTLRAPGWAVLRAASLTTVSDTFHGRDSFKTPFSESKQNRSLGTRRS